jgi:MFS family permease
MLIVLRNTWALFWACMLLMLGNGLQGTLLGIRGAQEGFTTREMSVVMSAYFLGFLARLARAPAMIRRVGHVRVFAALGSLISAALILYAAAPDPIAWTLDAHGASASASAGSTSPPRAGSTTPPRTRRAARRCRST